MASFMNPRQKLERLVFLEKRWVKRGFIALDFADFIDPTRDAADLLPLYRLRKDGEPAVYPIASVAQEAA